MMLPRVQGLPLAALRCRWWPTARGDLPQEPASLSALPCERHAALASLSAEACMYGVCAHVSLACCPSPPALRAGAPHQGRQGPSPGSGSSSGSRFRQGPAAAARQGPQGPSACRPGGPAGPAVHHPSTCVVQRVCGPGFGAPRVRPARCHRADPGVQRRGTGNGEQAQDAGV